MLLSRGTSGGKGKNKRRRLEEGVEEKGREKRRGSIGGVAVKRRSEERGKKGKREGQLDIKRGKRDGRDKTYIFF